MRATHFLTGLAALVGSVRAAAAPADTELEDQAGIPHDIPASYFVKSGYVFGIDVVKSNGDVYYHMNAPSTHSWYGVGFGRDMNNVRMLIAYMGANGHNVTNSCRMSYGEREPVWDPDCVIDPVWHDIYGPYANTISPGSVMISHAICRGCASWMGGAIDLYSTEQPFIYALGPNVTLNSDSPAANLRMHEFHASFTLDMTKAVNYTGDYARIPAPQDPANQPYGAFWSFANAFSSLQYNASNDTEWAPMAHGVFMCLAFLLIFPLGAVVLRTMKRAMYHAFAQLVGMAFVLVGFAFAIYVSLLYNKSRKFNSPHQIIGLLIISVLCIQVGLGFTHHFIYLRTRSPTIMGQIHRFLGISTIVLALVNAGVGWNFAGNSLSNMPYGIVTGIVGLIFVGGFIMIIRTQRNRMYKPERHSFVPQDYKEEPPAEYEMHTAPFASMGDVQEHRTPRWMESNDSLRHTASRGTIAEEEVSGYTDNVDRDKKQPYNTTWEPIQQGP